MMRKKSIIQALSVSFVAILLLVESSLELIQIVGLRVHTNVSPKFIGFDNPGPLGGFIAVLLAITVSWCLPRLIRIKTIIKCHSAYNNPYLVMLLLTGVSSFLGSIALVATLSRSAWAGFFLAAVVFIIVKRDKFRRYFPSWKKYAPIFCVVVFIFSVFAFSRKIESAIGRFHIWHIECRVIAGNPINGVGKGLGLGAYGLEQEEFFRERERSAIIKRIAGSPEYAFNEYLGKGMEYGIPGLIISILIVVIVTGLLLRNNSPFAYGAIVFAVFSFGSYPLSLWQFQMLGIALLIASIVSSFNHSDVAYTIVSCIGFIIFVISLCMLKADNDKRLLIEKEWRSSYRLYHLELFEDVISKYQRLYPQLKDNYSFLFDYGYALYRSAQFSDAIFILGKGAAISSDPMFHNIMGRCYEAMNEFDEAENEYLISHYMVPGRLYPLVLLKEMYTRLGDKDGVAFTIEQIREVPINPRNYAMVELQNRALGDEEVY